MDNKNVKSILQDALEEQIPASQINLLPAMQSRLVAGKKSYQPQGENMNKNRTKRLVLSVLTAIVIIAMTLITPQERTFAQNILRFFTRANSDTLPIQSFQLTPIPKTITPDRGYIFNQSVIEAGQKAGFMVLVPTFLPKVLSFEGGSYEPDHNIVRIFYSYEDTTNGLVIREERFQTSDDCELCGTVGASADIEILQIGDVAGEYVEGVWNLTDNGPIWVSDPYLKTLRWQKNGIAFELLYMGPPEEVTKSDLVAIADSLK
jgi:hypothetical protein